jgi:long-subunit acyl-CoA synthetase (AMP-forming)
MVVFVKGLQDIVLLSPGESLFRQLAQWAEQHEGFALRVVPDRFPQSVYPALGAAALAIIDANAGPRRAAAALEGCLAHAEPERVAVDTEAAQEELERLVRSRGVAFWLGPMSQQEWEAVLDVLKPLPSLRADGPGVFGQPGKSSFGEGGR